MKYFDFGASLLAYGIISVVGYCIFLVWMLLSAPDGDNVMPKVGNGGISMAASMGQAFSIQTFFIPILRKNKNQSNYQLYTLLAYCFGIAIYMYIAFSGSYGKFWIICRNFAEGSSGAQARNDWRILWTWALAGDFLGNHLPCASLLSLPRVSPDRQVSSK